MKNLFLFTLACLSVLSVNAQNTHWCGTDEYNEKLFDANPGMRERMHEHLTRITSGEIAGNSRDAECIIPVVVHVLHDYGDGNISHEQIQSGIDMLNEDFNRENDDAIDTRDTEDAPFLGIASNMGIRFELAKIDPDGNCTNGVQRRYVGGQSFNGGQNSKHYSSGGLDAWDRNFYFNIWIVNSINSDGAAGTILGYAEFPYSGGSSNYGIIIRNDAYGTTGTASGDRTLTHEVGHCLGLLHTFQGGCHGSACDSNGDYCCDTPPQSEAQWSCSETQNTCSEIPSGDLFAFNALDQFENYMSYSPCQNMYSEDQKNIVLGNLESIGFLSNLVDPDHYDETGVGYPAILCKAQFMSGNPTICAGGSVQYTDDSYALVTSRTWTFEGGTPSTSTEANPTVTYDAPGIYQVQLEVTDGISTVSSTTENYVLVLPNPGTSLPYSENFESITEIPDNDRFLIVDEDNEDAWELNDEVGYGDSHCAYIKNRGNNNRTKDELISGTIDLSGVDPDDAIIFNFKYAYHKRNSSNDEWLRFYISNDCGATWVLRKNIHGDDLSEEEQNSSYVPESDEEWTQVNITNINSSYYTANFRYKFQFENDNGNNIYLDDINMYSGAMVGLDTETVTNGLSLSVYPNPTQGVLNINLTTPTTSGTRITLLNTIGKEIETIYSGDLSAGESTIAYNVEKLPAGIYFVRMINDTGKNEVVRFVKN